jgi:FtsH-binding integral membrane protein
MTDTARRLILGILVLGILGVGAELLLLAHDEDVKQLIPFVMIALAAAAIGWVSFAPSPAAIRIFQVVMVLFLLSGATGMVLHFRANVEFQTEVDPSIKGMALFAKAARAKTPPALAPGAMIQLGLLGLAYTFKHPASNRSRLEGTGPE